MHEKRYFWENFDTWANSDLPAVDILNLIYKAAAATWPPELVYFAVFVVLFIELF